MREIIFRGKPKTDYWFFSQIWADSCKDGFVYGSLLVSKDKYYICVSAICAINQCVSNGTTSMIEVDPSTVGQYTGLIDKNETRIFEGDVIKVKWGDGYQYRFVYYENGIFKAPTKADSNGAFFIVSLCSFAGFDGPKTHCEVAGNVFDDADLLK